jgi:tRNA dimethylallyltransferase
MQLQFDEGRPAQTCRVFVLDWPRSELHRRIDRRVDRMFELGLIDEVRGLLERHGTLSKTASQAVGYRQVLNCLNGQMSEADTIECTKARTRQFAKRQITWFRSLSECRWIEQTAEIEPDDIARHIVASVPPR